ncbi:hypothetical protein B0T10DRAFT_563740 [Thelonectria olida]|uniref:Uncharacterized protein n=1 Tax=Thelonectria olida TaxID=1576542 RepID=A0A9P9AMY5_9HYPO|nr:hypothetical protein B0T10DRAFT_563740 [Thelonectria olida]
MLPNTFEPLNKRVTYNGRAKTHAGNTLSARTNPWSSRYYTGHGLVANVACYVFTSSTDGGDYEHEFLIWLNARDGAGPISATGSSISTVMLTDNKQELWQGTNLKMPVFSFGPRALFRVSKETPWTLSATSSTTGT